MHLDKIISRYLTLCLQSMDVMDIKTTLKTILTILYYIITFSVLTPLCGKFLIGVYNNFMVSSISFTLDTLFLDWNTSFASVTVCEIYNGEKNWDLNEELYGIDRDVRVDDFISEITYFRGICETCKKCATLVCPTNFAELIEIFRTPCKDLITNCTWNNQPFNCCDKFLPIKTEFGKCFSFNSIQTGDNEDEKFYMNQDIGPGNVTFYSNEDVQIFVHPPNDVPFLYSEDVIKETVLLGSRKEIILNVMDIYNDPSVYRTTPEFRKCRFKNEVQIRGFQHFRYYSFSTCVIECAIEMQMEACGCQFFDNEINDTFCEIDGIMCLSNNMEKFVIKRRDCDCMSSCEEPVYNIVYASTEQPTEGVSNSITISMIELPTQRYVRKVVKTDLDLFISIGGIAGLFFGLSFISVLDLIYDCFEKLKMRIQQKQTHALIKRNI